MVGKEGERVGGGVGVILFATWTATSYGGDRKQVRRSIINAKDMIMSYSVRIAMKLFVT